MDELRLELAVDPVALLTRTEARSAFSQHLAARLADVPYLFAAPVTLRVSCPTRPALAPGLVEYPNLATWLAPLTEALAGADRVLLGTSQVTAVDVTTRARSDDAPDLLVSVLCRPGHRLPKAGLRLVAFADGWCASVPTGLGTREAQVVVRRLSEALTTMRDGGQAAAHPAEHGLLRRRDLAPDVPVVPAARLLGPTSADLPSARPPVPTPVRAAS